MLRPRKKKIYLSEYVGSHFPEFRVPRNRFYKRVEPVESPFEIVVAKERLGFAQRVVERRHFRQFIARLVRAGIQL